jgi:hypothetical protein
MTGKRSRHAVEIKLSGLNSPRFRAKRASKALVRPPLRWLTCLKGLLP